MYLQRNHKKQDISQLRFSNVAPCAMRHALCLIRKVRLPLCERMLLLLLSLFLIFSSVSYADMKDILNKFQPYIMVEEEFNDNINLTARNRIDDFITTLSPGIRFSTLPRAETTRELRAPSAAREDRFGLDLDYRLGLIFYAKEKDNNFVGHDGTLNAWYSPNQRFTFRVRDYLTRSDEPRERDYASGALQEQYLLGTRRGRSTYTRNVFEPSVEYRFGMENIASLNYRYMVYRNQSPLSENSEENFINPRVTYRFDIRNSLSVDYSLTKGTFERSSDFIAHMAMGRYTYRFNPRTLVFADYSFETRNFDSPSIDYKIHRPSIGAEHNFSPTLSGRVQGGYFWQNPKTGSTTKGFYYDLGLTKRAERTSYTLSFAGGYTEDYFTAENRGFTKYHRALATISHQLSQHLSVGGNISYERAKSEPDAKDRIWGIGVNGSYRVLRWLTATLDFSHRENHSKNSDLDYSEYRGVFRITASY